jgi:hypothetical protein
MNALKMFIVHKCSDQVLLLKDYCTQTPEKQTQQLMAARPGKQAS